MGANALIGADNLRNFISKLKPLIELADYLEEIGKLEQVADEAKRASDAAKADLEATVSALDNAKAELEKAKLSAADAIRAADAAAEKVKTDAQAEADSIIAAAQARADETAERITAAEEQHVKDVREHELRIADLASQIERDTAQLESINAAVAEAKAKLGL